MQEQKYNDLEDRATDKLYTSEMKAALLDHVRKLEARSLVHDSIEEMKESGQAYTLSEEEEKMLLSFRRFKLRMRKNGEVFTWQTAKPEGVQLVQETAEIVHPAEVGKEKQNV